jgi:hypothetical protein
MLIRGLTLEHRQNWLWTAVAWVLETLLAFLGHDLAVTCVDHVYGMFLMMILGLCL